MFNKRPTNYRQTSLVRPAKLVLLAVIAAALAVAACQPEDATSPNEGTPGLTTGGTGFGGFGGGGGTTTGNSTAWCAVQALLAKNCQSCHNEALAFGAPMKLLSHADMMASAPLAKRPVYQVALERVKASGAERMPPSPKQPLAADEIATLESWVNAGAPTGTCTAPSNGGSPNGGAPGAGGVNPGGAPGAGGTNPGGAPGTGGTNPGGAASSGGSGNDYPPDCIDCANYSCNEGRRVAFRAHKNVGKDDTEPFDAGSVGANGQPNSYECFYYEAPWGDTTQLIGHRPIIDNERVIHHWLLYASNTAPPDLQDGGRRSYCQFQPDANRVLLAGWAPGTPGANLPANVGQQLPHGERVIITLEVHYFNTQPGPAALDRSGVEVCLTDTPRQNEASMHWLGTENINIGPNAQVTAGDTCTPNQGKAATILRVWPHMHLTGTHATLDLIRQNGAREKIHDGDFSFHNQTMYELPQPVTVNPGDRLDAKCTFQNREARTINFGEGSTEEMCYIFTLAYPAGALHNNRNGCLLGVGCVPGGVRRCIDNENILTAIGGL